METFLVGIVSLVIGGFVSTRFQRFHATWLKRRDVAAEAYGAAVAVHSALTSSVAFARRVEAEGNRSREWREVGESADWHLTSMLEASTSRINALREARLNIRSIWGGDVAGLFDDFFDLASSWHNAFNTFRIDVIGASPPDDDIDRWDRDETGYNWAHVTGGVHPDAQDFDREVEEIMELIVRFARSAGVVTTDLLGLPWGAREVVSELEERRRLRQLAAQRRLSPPR